MDTIINVTRLHNALVKVRKDVAARNTRRRKHAREVHNARTNVVPLTINKGAYVMIGTHFKKIHKLQPLWCSPMQAIETKFDSEFIVEGLFNSKNHTGHTQRAVLNHVSKDNTRVSDALVEQAAHFDRKTYS